MSRFSAVESIGKRHNRKAFDCGKAVLNDYLQNVARQAEGRDLARTYVVCRKDTVDVIGFFTLVSGEAKEQDAPTDLRKGLGGHPIPVVTLARLAVDVTEQKKGLGSALLKEALQKVLAAAEFIGVRALLVHAKDDELAGWYRHFGFEPSPTDELHLFLPLNEIRNAAAG